MLILLILEQSRRHSCVFLLSHAGAVPVIGVSYGPTTNVPISITSPECIGGEASLLDCPTTSPERIGGAVVRLGETNKYQNNRDVMENIVGARCEGEYITCIALINLFKC